jgi:HK97 family phage prohead protease
MEIRKKATAAPPPADDPLDFVMSDGSVDRMGDVIEPDGWQLDGFRRNPIALFGHDPRFPIGKWRDVGVRKGQLTGSLELMEPVSDRLREIHTAVEAGVLRAVSVGFHSETFEPLKSGGLRFTEAELVECSLVSVPANPNALAVAKALGLSRETRAMIFGGIAEPDQTATTRGLNGGIANGDSKSGTRKMNYSERIEAAQQDVVALQDQLAGLPDAEDVQKVSDLTARIGEVKGKIFAWVEAEKALGSEATPITIPKERIQVFAPSQSLPSSAARAWAQPKRKETAPLEHIVRHFVVKTLTHIRQKPAELILAEEYGSHADFEATKGVHDYIITRAATAPATTTTAGWAAELAVDWIWRLVQRVMAGSIFQPVAVRAMNITLGRYAPISMPTRAATPTIAGSVCRRGRADPSEAGGVHRRGTRPQEDGRHHLVHPRDCRALDASDRDDSAAAHHGRHRRRGGYHIHRQRGRYLDPSGRHPRGCLRG